MSKLKKTLFEMKTICREIFEKRGKTYDFDRFEHRWIENNGLDLSIDILENSEAKETIIFMPGTNAYTMLYSDYLFALHEKGYNVVAFDPRGHGKSAGTPGRYSVEELQSDFQTVFNYCFERWKKPIIVSGSSQGGITAFYLSLAEPRVKAAICHNLADLSDDRSVELTRIPRLSRLLKKILPIVVKFFPNIPFPMLGYLDLKVEPVKGFLNAKEVLYKDPFVSPYVTLKTINSLAFSAPPRLLEQATCPLYLVQAGNDTIFREDYMKYIFDKIGSKNKVFKIYPNLPHYMIADHVEHFIDDIDLWAKNLEEKRCSIGL